MRHRTAIHLLIGLVIGLSFLVGSTPSAAAQTRPPFPPAPAPLFSAAVTVSTYRIAAKVDGAVAQVTVSQEFRNNGPTAEEGVFVFPLPADAAVSDLAMTVDGQVLEGQLYGEEEARRIYEAIVRSRRDPALLDYLHDGLFQTRVFPIPPGATRLLTLTYTQLLAREQTFFRLEIPLVVPHDRQQMLAALDIDIALQGHPGLRTLYSVNHPVRVDRLSDSAAQVTYHAEDFTPHDEFVLIFASEQGAIGATLLSYRPAADDGYFLLMLTPGMDTQPADIVERDIMLVLDVSGSMAGQKMQQAKQSANFLVDHLNPGDRFNMLAFSTGIDRWRPTLQSVTEENKPELHSWIDSLAASGSTDINLALLETLAQFDADSSRPAYILFLTDGLPTQGVIAPTLIVENALLNAPTGRSIRLFTFGVGYDVNTDLLGNLSQELGGRSYYVRPNEAIDEAVGTFYAGISTPVLADPTVDFGPNGSIFESYPTRLPDLFAGEQLVIAGRYRGPVSTPFTLELSGQINGKQMVYRYPEQTLVDHGGDYFVARLWASRKIGTLLDAVRRNGPDPEVVDAIVELSRRFGIVTPYTSYLVEEPLAPSVQIVQGRPRAQSQMTQQHDAQSSLRMYAAAPASGEVAVAAAQERTALQWSEQPAMATGDALRTAGSKSFVRQTWAAGTELVWIDRSYRDGMPVEEVAFGSTRYFELAQDPVVAEWLTVAPELVVVLDTDQAIKVTESDAIEEPAIEPDVTTDPIAESPLPAVADAVQPESPVQSAPVDVTPVGGLLEWFKNLFR